MRKITKIIIHCSATAAGRDFTAADIDRWHRARGFNGIGYHYVVRLDGRVESGRPESRQGAHCLGQNSNSIGVCYIGGLKADGKTPCDTRTPEQKQALLKLVRELKSRYPGVTVHGHMEFAAKACPCFDAAREYATGILAAVVLLSLLLCSCSGSKVVEKQSLDSRQEVSVERVRELTDTVVIHERAVADSVRIVQVRDSLPGREGQVSITLYGPKRERLKASAAKQQERQSEQAAKAEIAHDSREKKPAWNSPVAWLIAGLVAGWLLRVRSFSELGVRSFSELGVRS